QQLALQLDATGSEPATRVQLDLQDVALGELLGDLMEQAPLRGTGALTADLRMTGLEPERIKRTLAGSGELTLRDGAILGINVAQELRNAMALLRGQQRTAAVEETDFAELALQFTADRGVVTWPSLTTQ